MSKLDRLLARQMITMPTIIDAIGHDKFYDVMLEELGIYLGCERYLAIKYSRFAAPEFIVNKSMTDSAVEIYLKALYRIDPLLRLVTENRVPLVATFSSMNHEVEAVKYYDEIFKSGEILDELSVMMPVMGAGYLALCFDRSDREFDVEEVDILKHLFPFINSAHTAHLRCELSQGLSALFSGGTVATVITDAQGQILYQNQAWASASKNPDFFGAIDRVLNQTEFAPIEVCGLIAHWESIAELSRSTINSRAIFFEKKSEGYLQTDIRGSFEEFYDSFKLSPRERQIVEKTMRGYSSAAIAEKLELSLGTVRNYKRNLYAKLDITSEREIFSLFMLHIFG